LRTSHASAHASASPNPKTMSLRKLRVFPETPAIRSHLAQTEYRLL